MLTVCLIQRDVSMEDVSLKLENVHVIVTACLQRNVSMEDVKQEDVHVIVTARLQRNVSMEFVFLILDVFLSVALDKYVLVESVFIHAMIMKHVDLG